MLLGDEKPPQVFVSHASEDKERFVLPFSRKLRANGVDAWLDRWEIRAGDSLVERIFEEGIGKSDFVIAVLSEHSAGSKWMRAELNAAKVREINGLTRLIPVRLDRVDSPPALVDNAWIDIDLDLDQDLGMAVRRVLLEIFNVYDRPPIGPRPDFVRLSAQLKDLLSTRGTTATVDRLVRTAADRAVGGFDDLGPLADLPDDAIPAVVLAWLMKCEETFSELLEMVAAGVNQGDPALDGVWVTTLDHILGAVPHPYPALLVSYAIGVAATARGRDELVHTVLNGGEPHALNALRLYRVLDLQRLQAKLSFRLRQVLRPRFDNLISQRQYESAFEDYEYLRTLLELHDSPSSSSLGAFAINLIHGKSNVDKRMSRRLAARSPLLRAGAFGGDPANVATARQRLDVAIRMRYS